MRDPEPRVEVNYWLAPGKVRSFPVYEYIAHRGARYGKTERLELDFYKQS